MLIPIIQIHHITPVPRYAKAKQGTGFKRLDFPAYVGRKACIGRTINENNAVLGQRPMQTGKSKHLKPVPCLALA